MKHEDLKDMLDERKGLLLIDGAYNTLLIPFESNEMEELAADFIHKNIQYVRKNKLKSDLNNSIKEYLNMEYQNKARDDS